MTRGPAELQRPLRRLLNQEIHRASPSFSPSLLRRLYSRPYLSVSLLAVIGQPIVVGIPLGATCFTCADQDTFPFAQWISLTYQPMPLAETVFLIGLSDDADVP